MEDVAARAWEVVGQTGLDVIALGPGWADRSEMFMDAVLVLKYRIRASQPLLGTPSVTWIFGGEDQPGSASVCTISRQLSATCLAHAASHARAIGGVSTYQCLAVR